VRRRRSSASRKTPADSTVSVPAAHLPYPTTAMSNKRSSKTGKRAKRDEDNESDESDDELENIHFFVPGENITAAVLVEYISRYVDRTAKITSAQHPTDKTRTGFTITAKRSLNAVSLKDLMNDSRDWDLETQGREYRKNPYDYRESDTARRRAKKGPSEGGTNKPQQPRVKRETPADPQDGGRQERPVIQSSRSGGNVQPQYQTQYSQYSTQSQPQGMATTSNYSYQQPTRAEQGPATNINITMTNAAAFPQGKATQPGYNSPQPYGSYTHQTQQETDAPPAYQQSAISRGGGSVPPPAQPGPDTFDSEKPVTSRTQSGSDRRPSTYDQPARRGR